MSVAFLATDRINSSLILPLFGRKAIVCDHERNQISTEIQHGEISPFILGVSLT